MFILYQTTNTLVGKYFFSDSNIKKRNSLIPIKAPESLAEKEINVLVKLKKAKKPNLYMQKLYDLLYRKNEKNYLLKRKHIDETVYIYDTIKKEFYLTLPKNFSNLNSSKKINCITNHCINNSNSSTELEIVKSFEVKDIKRNNNISNSDNKNNNETNSNLLFLEERKELWKELDKKLKNRTKSIKNIFKKSKIENSSNKKGLLNLENPRKLRFNSKIIKEIINKRKNQNGSSFEQEQYLTSNTEIQLKKETYTNRTELTKPEEKMNYLVKMSLECNKLYQYSSIIKDENNII